MGEQAVREFISGRITEAVVMGFFVGSALAAATLVSSFLFSRPPGVSLFDVILADYLAGFVAASIVTLYRRIRPMR